MRVNSPLVSVIIPVYNSQDSISTLIHELEFISELIGEVILVDDGSSDQSWSQINTLMHGQLKIIAIRLTRNFGQHNAILAGVRHASFDLIATLDDDLQNPPSELPKLLAALFTEVDVVYGLPRSKQAVAGRRVSAYVMKYLYKNFIGMTTATKISPFRLFRTRLRDGFESANLGPNVSIDSLLAWSTGRFTSVTVEHRPRQFGSSNYTATRLVRLALDTLTTYSTRPLRLASILNLISGMALGILFLMSKFSSLGYLPLALNLLILPPLFSLILFGEYLARIHNRVMGRPSFVIETIIESR